MISENVSFLLGICAGASAVISAWASHKAFGHWYSGGLLIIGIDTVKGEDPK